jgi:hypothetical protein
MSIFETLAQATKPEQNLKKEQAQEIADCFYNSSLEMAIASLENGLRLAKNTKNIFLEKIIEKDLITFREMIREKN